MNSTFIKKSIATAIIPVCGFVALNANADAILDPFSAPAEETITVNAGSTTAEMITVDASILGGEREIFLTHDTGGNDTDVTVKDGTLSFNSGSQTSGSIQIVWDGAADAGSDTIDETGLGGIDFDTGFDAFVLDVIESDDGFNFSITIYSDAANFTTLSLAAAEVDSPETFFFPFSLFSSCPAIICTATGAGVDLTNVGAVAVNVQGNSSLDFTLDAVRAVPAPGALALMGLGLLGVAGVARRKKQA